MFGAKAEPIRGVRLRNGVFAARTGSISFTDTVKSSAPASESFRPSQVSPSVNQAVDRHVLYLSPLRSRAVGILVNTPCTSI